MIDKKIIGVVVLNYKDAETTKRMCLKISSYNLINHIVIVDNLSPDDSFSKLKALKCDKIDVIQSDKNGGYSYGNNYGAFYLIEKYNIDVLFFANPDVEFEEDFVEKVSNIIITGKAVAASGVMLNRDRKIGINGTQINSYLDDIRECSIIVRRFFKKKVDSFENSGKVIKVEYLSGSLFGIDAKCFWDVQGFDENVFLYCEERILGKKFIDRGWEMVIDTSAKYLHLHSVSINKTLKRWEQVNQLYKSRLYYWEKYGKVGKIKILLLKICMLYGSLIRKIVYKLNR